MAGKRYYWFKLKKDFFKRHDIRILENMPDGEKIVLFYMKLLCESVDHDGSLRFSDAVPYTVDMLASVTGTPADIAKKGMEEFEKLGLLFIDNEQTIHMHNIENMLGSAADNDNANRQRRFRERQNSVTKPLQNVTEPVTESNEEITEPVTKDNQSIEKELEKEKELELDLEEKGIARTGAKSTRTARPPFKKPTVEEVNEYCRERKNGIDAQDFCDFYESKGWKVGNTPMKDWRACVRTWENRKKKEQKPARRPQDIPFMENEYTPEHLAKREEDSQKLLDDLLEE